MLELILVHDPCDKCAKCPECDFQLIFLFSVTGRTNAGNHVCENDKCSRYCLEIYRESFVLLYGARIPSVVSP